MSYGSDTVFMFDDTLRNEYARVLFCNVYPDGPGLAVYYGGLWHDKRECEEAARNNEIIKPAYRLIVRVHQ